MADKLRPEFFKMCHLSSGDSIISSPPVEQLPLTPSGPLVFRSGCLQHPSSCCHDLKQYLGLHKLQGDSGNFLALVTVLAGMLCFELDPPEHLQCRELYHQTPSSSFYPRLTSLQGSLSTAAAALQHCQEKGIPCGWEQPRNSLLQVQSAAAAPEGAGAAQHVSAAHPMQLSQHNVPAPAKGHCSENNLGFTAQR